MGQGKYKFYVPPWCALAPGGAIELDQHALTQDVFILEKIGGTPIPWEKWKNDHIMNGEQNRLRKAQSDAVMPLIGELLEAWENSPRLDADHDELDICLYAIQRAMENAGETE